MAHEELRRSAAVAAIRIDPTYSPEFLRELLAAEPPGRLWLLHGEAPAAAAALVQTANDEAARQFLLRGYAGTTGPPTARP